MGAPHTAWRNGFLGDRSISVPGRIHAPDPEAAGMGNELWWQRWLPAAWVCDIDRSGPDVRTSKLDFYGQCSRCRGTESEEECYRLRKPVSWGCRICRFLAGLTTSTAISIPLKSVWIVRTQKLAGIESWSKSYSKGGIGHHANLGPYDRGRKREGSIASRWKRAVRIAPLK